MFNLSLLQWLREVDHTKAEPKPYRAGITLVGLKQCSYFNKEYFFQYLLLNLPHKTMTDLKHPQHDKIPQTLQWYAAAINHSPQFWSNEDSVLQFLHNQGNRDNYITTFLAYLRTIKDMYFLWQTRVLSSTSLQFPLANPMESFNLDVDQLTVQNHVLSAIQQRNTYYSSFAMTNNFNSSLPDSDQENTSDESPTDHIEVQQRSVSIDLDWKKIILLCGKAGSGKSYLIKSIVHKLCHHQLNVLIVTPTGILASSFKATLPDEVRCDTVHAAFKYPVSTDLRPTINWELSNYDIIIIDEISMIPQMIFLHMLKTFNVLLFRPVVVLSGDEKQQQPFSRHFGKIMQLPSPFDDKQLLANSYKYILKTQHRVGHETYFSFLNTI